MIFRRFQVFFHEYDIDVHDLGQLGGCHTLAILSVALNALGDPVVVLSRVESSELDRLHPRWVSLQHKLGRGAVHFGAGDLKVFR